MHQPTLRVLQILERIAKENDGLRLADFSRELNIPKSTLVPILQTLCDQHYLSITESNRYTAGTALFCLGTAFTGSFPVLRYVRQQLELMVEKLGETCFFGALNGGDVLYLEKVESPEPIRMLTSVGRRLPAYATGLGKALLAGYNEAALRRLYPHGLEALTEHTVTDFAALAHQLAQASLLGYAWECEESTPHVRCFAVPIRKHKKVVAAISVTIPLFRYRQEDQDRILQVLQSTAGQMGYILEDTDAHFGELF